MKDIKYIILYLTVINYGSGSDFLTSYGSGSTSQKLRFLRFRFRFHNAVYMDWIKVD
jgi:hypothetical protein